MDAKYNQLVDNLTDLVGGKDNVSYFGHCVTRLRLDIKDKSLVQEDKIKEIPGVSGIRWVNNQMQIIIGPAVDDVYDAIRQKDGYEATEQIQENLDEPPAEGEKKKSGFSVSWLLEEISGAVFPVVTILIAASFVSLVVTILELFGLSEESNTVRVLSFVSNAGMYFLPIFVGYSAAKKFGGNVFIGMLLGAMMVEPNYVAAVEAEESLSIYGIPVTLVDYSSNFFPILLAVAVMVPVEKFFRRFIPDALKTVLVPFLTVMVMIPLTYCLIGPIASVIGGYLSSAMIWLYDTFGFLGIGIITAFSSFLVITGMHLTLVVYGITIFTTLGYEPTIFVAGIIATCVQCGICLAVMIKTKDTELKATSGAALVCAAASGTTEPALFGVTLGSTTTILATILGGFVGGCVAGLGGCAAYTLTYSAIWNIVSFVPGGVSNVVWMVIACIIGFAVSLVFTLMLFKDKADVTAEKDEAAA